MDKIPFAFSIHPGEILQTEFMKPSACPHIASPRNSTFQLPGSMIWFAANAASPPTLLSVWLATSETQLSSGLACKAATIFGLLPETSR